MHESEKMIFKEAIKHRTPIDTHRALRVIFVMLVLRDR
jgi:hypothetical protein